MGLLKKLSGSKTYILAVTYAVINLLRYFGVDIPREVDAVVLAAGGMALRAGVKKSG